MIVLKLYKLGKYFIFYDGKQSSAQKMNFYGNAMFLYVLVSINTTMIIEYYNMI